MIFCRAQSRVVTVDARAMKGELRKGLSVLARARNAIACDRSVLSGSPCIRGTCILVHDLADMLANGDTGEAVQDAFPRLSDAQIELALFDAQAYPRRGRPRRQSLGRRYRTAISSGTDLDELLSAG